MSYIGQAALKNSELKRFDVTSSTSTTHTLSWTAANEQSLFITINGVKQQDDAYTIAGSPTVITLSSALVAADKMEVIGVVDIGVITTVGDDAISTNKLAPNAVSTAKIADDAVTTDKLANSINTDITANTAKVTNATHTGDVTGSENLSIANDAVTTVKILDNNVTLAKMAGITRGSIIVGDASGDPSALGIGTSTYILSSDGTDAAWTAPAASGTANQPNFQVASTSNINWPSAVYAKIAFTTSVWESEECFDTTTNYRFTVPAGKGGKYMFVNQFPTPSGGNGYYKALKNGSTETGNFWWQYSSAYGGNKVVQAVWTAELTAGDYYEWYVYSSGGGNQNGTTYLSGWRFDT